MIQRLMKEARGKRHKVSVVGALEFRREQYGLTCYEFAAVLGITKSHYSEIRAGKRTLPLKAVKRAFRVGVPAEVLLQP